MKETSVEDIILKAKASAKEARRNKLRFYFRITILVLFLASIYFFTGFYNLGKLSVCSFNGLIVVSLVVSSILALTEELCDFPVKVAENKYKEHLSEILLNEEADFDEKVEDAQQRLNSLSNAVEEARHDVAVALDSRLEFIGVRDEITNTILK